MRRWLSAFLLVLLPLLSTWSVSSAYCVDEPATVASHLGHHVDAPHEGDPDNVAGKPTPGAPDAHCDHCHSPAVSVMLARAGALSAARNAPVPCVDVALRSPPERTPDRPQWLRLA